MLPLAHGMPVVDRRPLLPADVRGRVQPADRPAHGSRRRCICATWSSRSRAYRRAASSSPRRCRSSPARRAAERDPGAMRRWSRSTARPRPAPWRCGEPRARVGLARRSTACSSRPPTGATLARGSHFASPATLLDELELEADGSFTLARPAGRPDQDRRSAGFARRAQSAAAGAARSGGRRVLPPGDRQPDRAAVPDLLGPAARSRRRRGAGCARGSIRCSCRAPSSGSSGCRAATTASCAGRCSTGPIAEWQSRRSPAAPGARGAR